MTFVMAAARQMHSELRRTKHAVEDELVAFVLDCSRCGRRIHWVPGEGCALGYGRMRSRRRITDHGFEPNHKLGWGMGASEAPGLVSSETPRE